jgi:hypothetical protein
MMLHELPDRGRDRDAHFLGSDRRQLHSAEQPEDRQPTTRGDVGVHHHDGRGAIGELGSVARRRRAARVHGFERG